MGDTGSLTIGGIIAVFAIVSIKVLIPILRNLLDKLIGHSSSKIFQKAGKKGHINAFSSVHYHSHFRTTLAQLDPNWLCFTKPAMYSMNQNHSTFRIVTIVLAAITIITLKIR